MSEIEHSESLAELAIALAKAQAEMKGAVKDSTNPHFQSKYAGLDSVLEACRPALTSNGLAVVQAATAVGNVVSVTTMLLHASGQWMRSTLPMTARDASPQAIGSCCTYGRRYGLSSMVGIAPEDDDDGNAASGPPPSRGQQRERRTEQARRESAERAPYANRERAKLEPPEPHVEEELIMDAADAEAPPHAPSIIDLIERFRVQLRPTDLGWKKVLIEFCGTEAIGEPNVDPAALDELLTFLQKVAARDKAALAQVQRIVAKP